MATRDTPAAEVESSGWAGDRRDMKLPTWTIPKTEIAGPSHASDRDDGKGPGSVASITKSEERLPMHDSPKIETLLPQRTGSLANSKKSRCVQSSTDKTSSRRARLLGKNGEPMAVWSVTNAFTPKLARPKAKTDGSECAMLCNEDGLPA